MPEKVVPPRRGSHFPRSSMKLTTAYEPPLISAEKPKKDDTEKSKFRKRQSHIDSLWNKHKDNENLNDNDSDVISRPLSKVSTPRRKTQQCKEIQLSLLDTPVKLPSQKESSHNSYDTGKEEVKM